MNKSRERNRPHCPTVGQCRMMRELGLNWEPPRDKRDNRASKYEYKDNTESIYKSYIKKREENLKNIIKCYTNDDGSIDSDLYEDENYMFLMMTIQERLNIPDSRFVGDGTFDSNFDEPFSDLTITSHKGNRYTRIRVPSLKRGKSTWQRFYNEFPDIAAEARFGDRRFINGAKLKYIW